MKRPLRIAVNGLGRVGRIFIRIAWGNSKFQIIAANSRSDLPLYGHLLKYDSVYGPWADHEVKVRGNNLIIDGKLIRYFKETDADNLPWKKIKPDMVVEASGKYKNIDDAAKHNAAGARYTVITAPIDGPGKILVMGVNEKTFDPAEDRVVSAASCTSVCSSLVVKVLEENFGIVRGFINTVHAFTSDQSLHDSSHRDFRRARAAAESIIPTTTGVTKTIDRLFPSIKGRISGIAYRVPVIDPSVLSLTCELKKSVDAKKVNNAFVRASKNVLKGRLGVSHEPLVSTDHRQMTLGTIVDLLSTEVVNGKMLNVVAWYDNEWGYVSQVADLLEYLGTRIK